MSLPQWKGLFDWSMKYQDGSRPSDWDAKDIDIEKMKWLEGVMKHYMQDFAARMKEIKSALDTGVGKVAADDQEQEEQTAEQVQLSLQDKENLLEELMDIVSSIDFARDLHKVGGLPTLLALLTCTQPSLQWRAAEVVATCMQNNPPVQQWFLDGNVLPPLLTLINTPGADEPQVLLRTKGLLALSALTRHHTPALDAALAAGAASRVAELCGDTDTRVRRKAFSLLQYFLSQQPSQLAALPGAGQQLVEAAQKVLTQQGHAYEGSDLRNAVLSLLQQLGLEPEGWDVLTRTAELRPTLSALQSGLATLPPEDQDSCQDEVQILEAVQGLLAGPRPAARQQGSSDHVPVDYDKGFNEPLTMNVSEPADTQAPSSSNLGMIARPMDMM